MYVTSIVRPSIKHHYSIGHFSEFTVWPSLALLYVDVHCFNQGIFIADTFIATNSQLNIISGSLREGLTEPWRVVELTAGIGLPTPLTIPQWVSIIKDICWFIPTSTVTEVVIANEWWYSACEAAIS